MLARRVVPQVHAAHAVGHRQLAKQLIVGQRPNLARAAALAENSAPRRLARVRPVNVPRQVDLHVDVAQLRRQRLAQLLLDDLGVAEDAACSASSAPNVRFRSYTASQSSCRRKQPLPPLAQRRASRVRRSRATAPRRPAATTR